jgi:hypothetical protein
MSLLNDSLAPITDEVGLFARPLEAVTEALAHWRRALGDEVRVERLSGDLPSLVRAVEPLALPYIRRELLVAAEGGWTAYFNSSIGGTDAAGPTFVLARGIGCMSLRVTSVPNAPPRYGCVRLVVEDGAQLESPYPRRNITCMDDGGRWYFESTGEPFDFEDVSHYRLRRKRDRFTHDMLADYCRALGAPVFDPGFFLDSAVVLHLMPRVPGNQDVDIVRKTLAEVRRDLGIVDMQ